VKSRKEIIEIINHASGTSAYHKFSHFECYPVVTDGVIAIAEATGYYWLLDIIGSYQTDKRLDPHFQIWRLAVNNENQTAVVSGYNDTVLIIKQDIQFTDFPLDELKLYLMNGVILLLSEYRTELPVWRFCSIAKIKQGGYTWNKLLLKELRN